MKPLGIYLSAIVAFFSVVEGSQGSNGEKQQFRVRPESVEVRSGEDVYLRCVVENQQGKAQWTKDGFALGFERHVPGYPRYSYSGDSSKGEHHLIIKGVTLEDDGEYQCQVGPTMGTGAIWAAANVTVMVSPASVTLLDTDEGSKMEVVVGSTLQLQCLVSDARPAPSVAWYRGGKLLDQGLQEDRIKSSNHARLLSVVSRMSVKVNKEDDGQQYSCRALHPTLRDSRGNLVTTVVLSVLHPPSQPIITGYKTGEVLQAGDKRTLTCGIVGGNPRPWLTWYWHGWDTNSSNDGKAKRKTVILKDKPSGKKWKKSKGVSVTHQVTASREEDGVVYECRVTSSQLSRPLSANVSLTVHYAPARVMVTGSSAVAAGKPFTLTCSTSPANPPASLTWIVDGKQIKNEKSEEVRANGSGWITSSELTKYASRSLEVRQVKVQCEANHPTADSPITHTRLISVTRMPGPPTVEVDVRGQVVAGTVLELTCTSRGGYPAPRIRLFKGTVEVEVQEQQRGNMTWARAAFKVEPADNGAKVRCDVTNAATTSPLTAHTTINLLFPAWEVTTACAPKEVEAGEVATLTCESSPSLPPSTLTWHSGGATLEGATTTHSPGDFGGTVTRSVLVVRPLADDNGRVFTCEADNGLGITVDRNLTLDVLHGAVWLSPPSGTMKVNEGEEFILTAVAAANPGPIRYTWQAGSSPITSEGSSGGELRIRKIRRQQSGNYSVKAQSPRGTVKAHFLVNVLYGPENVISTPRVKVDKGSTAELICSALGNPTPNITWIRPQEDRYALTNKSRGILATGLGESRLLLEWVLREDTGIYHCIASSVVSTSNPVVSIVIVKQAPWNPHTRRKKEDETYWTTEYGHDQSVAAVGSGGRLDCRVWASPKPTFTWSTDTGLSIITNSKYVIEETELVDGIVEWQSILEVKGVSLKDYINYTCTATNTEGLFSTILTLRPPATPVTPEHFTAVNVTATSALFVWKRHTNGRRPSGFTIKYWTSGARDYKRFNLTDGNKTSAVVNGLTPGTDYYFTIEGFNDYGTSGFTAPPTLVMTMLGAAESASSSSSSSSSNGIDEDASSKTSRLILFIMTLSGTALLALNMAIIACFVRKRSHNNNNNNNRGVSASSSKTTTLEVFTPATTPGANTQGEELPLTDAMDFPHALPQKAELQTSVTEKDFTHLYGGGGLNKEHNLVPITSSDTQSNNNPNATATKSGRSAAQNGGLYLQKYRETGTSYYYCPIPQVNYSLNEKNVVSRLGNTPDVCPTDTTLISAQKVDQQHTQDTSSQLVPEGQDHKSLLSVTTTQEEDSQRQQHSFSDKKPQQQQQQIVQQQQPQQKQQHVQQQQQQQQQLQQNQQQHQQQQHLQQQQQQQVQQRHHEWTPYDQIRAAGKDISHIYHQQQSQAEQTNRRLLQQIDEPDLYKFNEEGGIPLGYATVAPRRPRPLPNRFSTLQRSRPSHNFPMPVGQISSPLHDRQECNHLSPGCPHNSHLQNMNPDGASPRSQRSHTPRHQLVRSFSENYALVSHASGPLSAYTEGFLQDAQGMMPSDKINPLVVATPPRTLANEVSLQQPLRRITTPVSFTQANNQNQIKASSRDVFEGGTFN